MQSKEKIPVLFIGHGSPEIVITKNKFTEALSKLGKDLPRPKAIMVVSAHWLTDGTFVGCMEKPRTIYDFYGFPEEMYKMKYPSEGSPEFAKETTKLVKKTDVKCDLRWGLDHASWAVLKHMYPKADVPVFEMSLDYSPYNAWHPKPLQYHYDIAKQLSKLRNEGVLIIGSGNLVHNLGIMRPPISAAPFGWAVDFDKKVKECLEAGDHKALINYTDFGESAELSVPTLDHYLPMIYALGLQEKNEPLEFFYEGFQYSSVSMRGFRIG